MDVYEFEKSLLERMEESCNVLQCKGAPVPAADVREEWACHVELKIEPAGWQAIWKMNRATCEQYKIKYPTIVLGTVNNIYFQDLMADFSIIAVQDDDVHLPAIHEVPLEDLWPTIKQENTELNIERTADCIDELRFFYRNVWMPWDNDSDEDVDWCKKHLESRIRFCFDLKRNMSRGMADHIRKLLAEARYIQNKREIMELEMSDDEDAEEDPEKVGCFMRMQLRLVEIRNEVEMLVNPMFRRTYEDLHFKAESKNNNTKYDETANVFIVTKEDTINKQMEYLDAAKKLLGSDEIVKFSPSLKDCLKVSVSRDYIYLPSIRHTIRLVEPLNSGGLLKAVYGEENNKIDSDSKILESMEKPIITPEESDNVFLSFNGDYTIENVILDCRQVRVGIWIKGGTVTLKNCRLIGDRKSSTGVGIAIAGDGKCALEKTLIQNFATGINCASGGSLNMIQTTISKCATGLETSDAATLLVASSQISDNSDYAIFFKTKSENVIEAGQKKKIVSNFNELGKLIGSFALTGDCALKDNKKGNIAIVDQKNMVALQHAEFLEDNFDESGFKNDEDVSMTNGLIPNGFNKLHGSNDHSLLDADETISSDNNVSIIIID